MTRTLLLGNLPVIGKGINKKRLDRNKLCEQTGLSKKQIYKAYNNWIQIFRIPDSTLTFEQYLIKLDEAGIKPEDVGNYSQNYHLSRYNDEGPYTNESCRFIPKPENMNEQVRDPPYIRMLRKYGEEKTIEYLRRAGRKGALIKNKMDR